MGLGDIFGDAVGAVEHTATGLYHGAEAVANVGWEVGKGAAWAAQPDHWDEIANGIGAVGSGLEHAGEFAWHHPGQAWDIGFNVGRTVLKEELKPKNLAIDAAMIAASVFTGGGSGAALAARIGGEALKGARAVDEVVTGGRIARTAVEAGRVISAASEASGVTGAVEATARGVAKATDVLGYVPEKIRQGRTAIGLSEYGWRGNMANRIATEADIEAGNVGLLRGAVSDVVRSSSTAPGRVSGQGFSHDLANINYARSRTQMYKGVPSRAQGLAQKGEAAYQIETDPVGYGMKHGGRTLLGKAESYAARKATKMFGGGDEPANTGSSTSYLTPTNVYQPVPDTPDLGMSRGYGSSVGGGYAPRVSDESYTSSLSMPAPALGRGASFYQGAGMVANPYEEENY